MRLAREPYARGSQMRLFHHEDAASHADVAEFRRMTLVSGGSLTDNSVPTLPFQEHLNPNQPQNS
jgi:hypothetical protein